MNELSHLTKRAPGAGVRVREARVCLLLLSGLITLLVPGLSAGGDNKALLPVAGASGERWANVYAHLPLSFELNQGQTDGRVKYLARGPGYTVFLTSSEAVLKLASKDPGGRDDASASKVVSLKLVGAKAATRVVGEEELGGQSHYLVGKDPSHWHTHIPSYAKVRYGGLYDGVDLVYYGHQGELEYDFEVAPGTDPGRISLRLEGAQGLEVNAAGDLEVEAGGGQVRFHRPVAYQASSAGRQLIAARYVVGKGKEISFGVGAYDHKRPLIIDPVLSYATYLGGTGGDVAYGIAVDSSGNAYVTGITNSSDFPTANARQGANKGNGDAFVMKLNPAGTGLLYSSYLGGAGSDTATAITVDSSGNAFITGTTTSEDFPTTANAFQVVYGGNGDAFVVELGSGGNSMVYSSYLGGSGADFGAAIAVDAAHNAYVTGSTQSVNFPGVNPLQSLNGGTSDAFVAKVDFSGLNLIYSTYLGGSAADVGQGIKVDSSGNAYVVGYTFSSDFPTLNALQPANAGAPDAFVAEVNPSGGALVFSTYLGGSGDDRGFGLALDASGSIYITGTSHSTDFPTESGVFQTGNRGNGDAFVSKLNPAGSVLTYSTFLGGTGAEQGYAIAADSSGNPFITGFTQSTDFPTRNPVQGILGISGGSSCGATLCADAFVTELNPSGSGVVYSTYLGGSGADFGQAIALDPSGLPYVTGSTSSSNFPAIAGALQGGLAGVPGNTFVAKIDSSDAPGIAIVPVALNFGNQTFSVRSAVRTVTVINAGSQPLTISQIVSSSVDFAETDNCVGTLAAGGGTCTLNITFTPSALGAETDVITITDNATANLNPHTVTVTGSGVTEATAVTVSATSLTFSNQDVGTVSAPQMVTITNTGSATLNITQISVSGDFTETETCSARLNILNVGESCTVSVSFAPSASGSRGGALSIYDNAVGSPQQVSLSGNGLAVFSVTTTTPTSTVVIGSTTATFSFSATAPSSFTGNITLTCSSGPTCTFSPTSIFPGQTSTLTVSNLTTAFPDPFNFVVNGISGSQTATIPVSLLFMDFSLSRTPALNTIVSGGVANYSIIVTPLNGFNQQVNLTCANLPAGASCAFSPSSATPNGGAVTVALVISTASNGTAWIPAQPWAPLGGASPPVILWVLGAGILWSLFHRRRRLNQRGAQISGPVSIWPRVISLSLVLVAAATLLGSCRSGATSGTPNGNYTITVTGTLGSNTTVVRNTSVNLSVT